MDQNEEFKDRFKNIEDLKLRSEAIRREKDVQKLLLSIVEIDPELDKVEERSGEEVEARLELIRDKIKKQKQGLENSFKNLKKATNNSSVEKSLSKIAKLTEGFLKTYELAKNEILTSNDRELLRAESFYKKEEIEEIREMWKMYFRYTVEKPDKVNTLLRFKLNTLTGVM